jgi:uncharacterized protein YkwD
VPRKLLIVAAALAALAVPATADARYSAQRVATARVALGHNTATLASFGARTATTAQAPAECANADIVPAASNLDAVRAAITCLHNQIRARAGLPLLKSNAKLRRAAEGHSADMVRARYFEHTTPSGTSMVDRILSSHYVRADQGWLLGENLEWGTGSLATPRGAMNAWMNSPGHKANILKRGYRNLGVGISLGIPSGDSTGVTITVDFGARR